MSKLHCDPATGRFTKQPASLLALSSNLASSSRPLLVFPTLRSHPIPGSFQTSPSPAYSPVSLDPNGSGSKCLTFKSFFDTLQHSRSSSLSPHQNSPASLDSLDDAQEPSPSFAYTSATLQPSSDSLPSPPLSSVSSVITSQSSSPGLAPQTSSTLLPLASLLSPLCPVLTQPSPSPSAMTVTQSQTAPTITLVPVPVLALLASTVPLPAPVPALPPPI